MIKIIFTILNIFDNIFKIMNIKTSSPVKRIARLLRAIDQPARLQILMAIGSGEACVCHLEAALGMRQAYLSQHLMALRKARVLKTRRDGRYIFYRLSDPRLLDLIQLAAKMTAVEEDALQALIQADPLSQCECPHCAAEPQDVEVAS
jgi:ArsR family transcriptional regulator